MRVCAICKKELDESMFYKKKGDMLHSYCKDCYKLLNKKNYSKSKSREYYLANRKVRDKYNQEYYLKNTDYIKKRCRKYMDENKEQIKIGMDIWRKDHPEAIKAHRLVAKAKKDGDLVSPNKCECGCRVEGVVEFHHVDYEYPLRGVWLRRGCHRSLHRGNSPELNKKVQEVYDEKYK